MAKLPYIVVVGGSYVGVNVAQQLASAFHGRFRVLLIEKNSHFQHLFAFPRYAVASDVPTHKAFIPYTPGTFANCPSGSGSVVQAAVTDVRESFVQLDREIELDGSLTLNVMYRYLIIATGTRLSAPSTLPGSGKLDGVAYLQAHARKVAESSNIVLIGGGAVGVQAATDIKELYPEKHVTLIHSRDRLMHKFHPDLNEIIQQRCAELGIVLKPGVRVKLPAKGFPTDGSMFNVEMTDGSSVSADFAIVCTGQVPQSQLIASLSPESLDNDGYIRTRKSLQISDLSLSNVFAIGDVAATGAHKAAKPAARQAGLVVENIRHLLAGEPLEHYEIVDPPGIHMSLGITKNIAFGNPKPGMSEPFIKHRNDGTLDMNIDGVWARRGGGIDCML